MNKVLYQNKHFKIKVRDIIIVLAIILLLFLILKKCENDEVREMKEEKIENICVLANENANDLNTLFSRADLCSDVWFGDLDDYIKRLEEQNQFLEKKNDEVSQNVYKDQQEILEALISFKDNQTEQTVTQLETLAKAYREGYVGRCVDIDGEEE